ncbi:MAG: type II secretion system F family protein [Planctomycetota bacterium]|jgi:type IV pilus assembly protein PilC
MPPRSTAQARREAALAEIAQKPRKARGMLGGRRVSDSALTLFTSQLAILQDAGLPIVRCMKILEGQMKPGYFKWVLGQVTEEVESGSALSEALAKHPGVFDELYVNMVKAGEAGGVLDTILSRLAEFKEKAQRLKKRIVSASIYPIVVLFVATAILLGIMVFVVPKFEMVFADIGTGELPALTKFMQKLSAFLVGTDAAFPFAGLVYIILAFVLLIVLIRLAGLTEGGKRVFDRVKLRLPLVGTLVRKTIVARFSRTFGTLIQSGVPILESLNIVRDSIDNVILKNAITRVHDAIREGENIAEPLGESGIFDDIVVNMIDVGEETGELDKMLLKVADTYDEEVDLAVASLVSIREPTLIVFMGVAVGLIVISLFMPLLKIVETIGGGA